MELNTDPVGSHEAEMAIIAEHPEIEATEAGVRFLAVTLDHIKVSDRTINDNTLICCRKLLHLWMLTC